MKNIIINDTLNSIRRRRSVRRYRPEQFPQADLETIIEAGLCAPSARNTQPWHLTVLRERNVIDELTREVKQATARMPENRYKELVCMDAYTINYGAPTFIIVTIDTASSFAPEADAALVLGYMFLAAGSLGIGSCWINQLNALNGEPLFRARITELGVPEGNRIYGCACFGYPEGELPVPPRREGAVCVAER